MSIIIRGPATASLGLRTGGSRVELLKRAAARRTGRRLRAADGDDGETAGAPDVFSALSAQLAAEIERRRGLALFEEELAKDDSEVDVARAALYVALHHTPQMDVEAYMARLDALSRDLEAFLPPPDERYTRRMLLAINKYMFEELGFKAAAKDTYYTVENSCLNYVLDNRTGIPLTLSCVYMELAHRVGLRMLGVNLPMHFMIRPAVEDVEVLVDPFNAGEIICVEDAEALLSPLYGDGSKVEIDRTFFNDNKPKPRSFLTRMLTNLKQIYFNSKQYESALLMIDYQALCAPDATIAALNTRDRGICLYLSSRFSDAVAELEGYLATYTAAVDRDAISGVIEMCKTALIARKLNAQLDADAAEDDA